MTATMEKNVKQLEKAALDKYEDLLDTVLVLEAMKVQKKSGKNWQDLKKKLLKDV